MNIDDTMLASYGITIADEDKAEFYKQLADNLEERVGLTILDKLNDQDAKELIELSDAADEAAVKSWLATHLPEHEEIAKGVLHEILTEVAQYQADQAK